MGEKHFAKEPLLYIEQSPTTRKPEAPMQHSYMTPNKRGETEKATERTRKSHHRPRRRARYFIDQLYSDIPEEQVEDEEVSENEAYLEDHDKKFSELSLQGKIQYFIDIPDYVPKIKCEIKTADLKYRGVITDFKENLVFIQVGKSTTSRQVPFEDIQDIRMLGF